MSTNATVRADALGLRARAAWLLGRWREALDSAEDAVATLEGLPESEELARALARLSQIQMLRGLPITSTTATRAMDVAVRTGESAAEANARINLFTARAALGVVPTADELSTVIDLALGVGAHDEAVRAVVNYLWSAALLGPLEPVERLVTQMATAHLERGLNAEAYGEYLQVSLAALIYVPSGRWAEADAVVAQESEVATNRLVWLWVVAGLALRRGDLELADRYLPELRETALASEEPQRILPMMCVAMPRALLDNDADGVRALADIVVGLEMQAFSGSATTIAISRSLAAIGDSCPSRVPCSRRSRAGPRASNSWSPRSFEDSSHPSVASRTRQRASWAPPRRTFGCRGATTTPPAWHSMSRTLSMQAATRSVRR